MWLLRRVHVACGMSLALLADIPFANFLRELLRC